MFRGMNKVKAAALAVVAVAGLSQVASAAEPAAYMQETDKGRKPLMAAADRTGFGQMLEDVGIDISGHAQVSYTWNFRKPVGDANVGRLFDDEHDEFLLNQIDVTVARTLTADDNAVTGYGDKVNVGFKMEWIYGKDARYIHANGLFDHYNDDADAAIDRNEEFDLNQAFAEIGVPVGNGLLFTVGKFNTPIGYELINPTLNPLFSHSYLFNFAIPFTHTGVTAKYSFNENFSLTGGLVRGWDQSFEDNNQDPSYLVSAAYNWVPGSGGEPINFIVTGITGPEQADEVDSWRTLVDVIVSTKVSDQLTLGLNADYAYEEEAEQTDEGVLTGKQAQWYGVATYAKYDISEMFAINARAEWFNDKDNSRGIGTNVYEATVGLTIKPFANHEIGSNLVIRPEVRYDYAQEGIFDGQNDQVTVAADVIFTF